MKKHSPLLETIDGYVLPVLLSVFIFLIPLYPKIPLIGIGYSYIAIRPEDFFVAVLVLVFGIQLLRKKVTLSKLFLVPILFFWGSILVSLASGIFLTQNIVYKQVALLHTFRRFEYMIIFLIVVGSIKTKKHFWLLFHSLFASLFLVAMYGLGQRFMGLPAVSTMNPEFARGRILFLTPEARLASTFAGHYDLAAYLVFMIPMLLGTMVALSKHRSTLMKNKVVEFVVNSIQFTSKRLFDFWEKAHSKHTFTNLKMNFVKDEYPLLFNHAAVVTVAAGLVTAVVVLALGTMQVTIAGILMGSVIVYFIGTRYAPRIFAALLTIVGILILILTASRSSFIAYALATPFLLLYLKRYKYLVFLIGVTAFLMASNQGLAERFTQTFQIRQFLINEQTGEVRIVQENSAKVLPAGSTIFRKVEGRTESDAERRLREEIIRNASLEAQAKGATSAGTYRQEYAVAGDTSMTTRLQVEWPRAIKALATNPLLGTGASSITAATDNDYLRWLGEFGLLGTLSFLYIIYKISYFIYVQAHAADSDFQPLAMGFLTGLAALMINAGYIDVFEASKVAFVFWYTSGMFVGLLQLPGNKSLS